jgi:hypothetical protein
MTTYARCLVGLLVLAPLAACNAPTDSTSTLYRPQEAVTPVVPPVSKTDTPAAPRTPACRPARPQGGCKVNPASGL